MKKTYTDFSFQKNPCVGFLNTLILAEPGISPHVVFKLNSFNF